MSGTVKQGIEARIVGKVQEVKQPIGNGPAVVVVRVSHGKDKATGEWRPSSWFDVRVFGEKRIAAVQLAKDDLVQLDVWGGTSEWTGKDGAKKVTKEWYCKELQSLTLEPF